MACGHKCPLWDISEAEASLPLLYFAGMTCKDVSQMNRQRLGILGASGRPLLTFLWELRYKRPAIVFTECTVLQDIEFLQREVGFIYELFTVVLSPSDLGWWVDRRRRFCILVLRGGPYTMESAYWQNFGSVFHKCRPEVPERGDMFFAAPPEHIDEDLQCRTEQAAAAAGLTRPSTWPETLGTSWQTRVVLAERIFFRRVHGIPEIELQTLPTDQLSTISQHLGDYGAIMDLTQNPSHTFTHSGAIPCILSKARLYSMRRKRLMLGKEMFLAQGIAKCPRLRRCRSRVWSDV